MAEYLKEGFYVKILNNFYRIKAKEPFQYDTGREATAHFSSVAAAGTSGWINITTLEPDDEPPHLFQIRFGVCYGLRYYIKIPTGNNRFGVDEDKDIGFVDYQLTPYDFPNEDYEFYLVHDYYPAFNAHNDQSVALTPKIRFLGMKYDIEKITDTDTINKLNANIIPYRPVTIGGVKT